MRCSVWKEKKPCCRRPPLYNRHAPDPVGCRPASAPIPRCPMQSRRCFLGCCAASSIGLIGSSPVHAEDKPEAKKADPVLTPLARKGVASGLKYLKDAQHKDGSFGTAAFKGSVGVTSLCGMAMLS